MSVDDPIVLSYLLGSRVPMVVCPQRSSGRSRALCEEALAKIGRNQRKANGGDDGAHEQF